MDWAKWAHRLATLLLAILAGYQNMPGKPAPSPAPVVIGGTPLPSPVTTGWSDLVNAERVKVGLNRCRADSNLGSIAQTWANHMAAVSVMSHGDERNGTGFPQRIKGYLTAGEVVDMADSPQSAMARWMNSPAHRAIILDPRMTRFGGGSSGSFYCLDFADDTGKP